METLEQAAHKLIRKISGFLSTDATARKLNELFRRMENGEVLGKEDARVVLSTLLELDHLHKRCAARVEQIECEIAKCPEHVREAYRDELSRGRV